MGGEGVLRISRKGDDRKGKKIKNKKNPRTKNFPPPPPPPPQQKNTMPNLRALDALNIKTAAQRVWLYFIRRTTRRYQESSHVF